MKQENFEVHQPVGGRPIKSWTRGVPVDAKALEQLANAARLPFIHGHIAVMPDVHVGIGATVGSVIPTIGAVIPAAVGVDIGCGMMAVRTSLTASDLPESLAHVRAAIEKAVPHGRSGHTFDTGAWGDAPEPISAAWSSLAPRFANITAKHPRIGQSNNVTHLGTLGTGNHFIEVCLDEEDHVWFMLHSGSRGVGNKIGSVFIEMAKEDMRSWFINLPDQNLAYFPEGTEHFADYVEAVSWAQDFARCNRELMMQAVIKAVSACKGIKPFTATSTAVNCHHNYVSREHHHGRDVLVTRKGAVRARVGDLGIIPGSMGARSFIVRGKGNDESFHSCSHGAGRVMSRTEAKKRITMAEHAEATAGIECRKDENVVDESPAAYKNIDAVMKAQADLVDVVHTLHQVVCVKG
ncbi:MAG: RtcB family protein [Deltaproteobacteria bacterium]|nr:RtcB family protein [Deltaproteobacteria bacterium]